MNKSKERPMGHAAMALMVAAVYLALTAPALANLVLDPGFELDDRFGEGGPWLAYAAGVCDAGCVPRPNPPHSGLQLALFFNNGSIYQVIPTTPGQTYEFTFWVSGDGTNWEGETFAALWEGAWVFGPERVLGSDWVFHSIIVTATSADTHITFRGESHVQLDDVSVTRVSEPATLALLGLGLAGIGFPRRKQ